MAIHQSQVLALDDACSDDDGLLRGTPAPARTSILCGVCNSGRVLHSCIGRLGRNARWMVYSEDHVFAIVLRYRKSRRLCRSSRDMSWKTIRDLGHRLFVERQTAELGSERSVAK